MGEEQLAQLPVSRRHWNVEPVSDAVKVKLASPVVTVPEGPPLIVVSGGVVSGGGGSGGWTRPFFLPFLRGSVPSRSSMRSEAPSRSVSSRRGDVFTCFSS